MTGDVPSRTSCTAARAAAGLPSARQITARALPISPKLARSSSSAASRARASPGIPARAWVASIQPVTWPASACDSSSCDPRRSAALNSSNASWWRPRPAYSVPLTMCKQRNIGPGVCLQGPFGALQPSLAFVELTRQHHRAGQRYQRGRNYPVRAPAMSLRERDRLVAAPPGRCERVDLRGERELREAADFDVRPADLPGEDGAFVEVAFGVGKSYGPCLDDPQIHQRHCSQVAAERDVFVGLPGYRPVEELGLFGDADKVAAPPRQRQLHRRDRYPEAAPAIWRRRLDIRLSDGEAGDRPVQRDQGQPHRRCGSRARRMPTTTGAPPT